MPSRIIAIGDIHGCSKALESVLEMIAPTPRDLIITMGDYVDRGPDSKGVVEQLLTLAEQCELVPLLGNHEIMLLHALEDRSEMYFWLHCGGHATLASYGASTADIPNRHLKFFESCRRYYETAEHLFVHANYLYDLPLAEQPDPALFWEHISYRVPARHISGKTAIVGHTPQPKGEILNLGHLVCIDTYCFGTGCLTALNVETAELWQADKFGQPWHTK